MAAREEISRLTALASEIARTPNNASGREAKIREMLSGVEALATELDGLRAIVRVDALRAVAEAARDISAQCLIVPDGRYAGNMIMMTKSMLGALRSALAVLDRAREAGGG